jgi:3-methyladenine DNA glycosylase AlkC
MTEPFRNLISEQVVVQAASHLQHAWPAFDRRGFERQASQNLHGLEMKARAMQIAQALDAHLPADFDTAAALIESALAPLGADGAGGAGIADAAAGLSGWVLWSFGEFVARRVAARPADLPRGLQCLRAMTQRFTAEFAIRPLLRDHPAAVWPVLHQWSQDASPAVRRLASEGSRPRLPWGLRLHAAVRDPTPAWQVLERLQDDPDEAVRRSVANHLNDIAKDHPGLLADWLARYLPGAPAPRRAALRHASRSLIKAGDTRVLAAWDLGQRFCGRAELTVTPAAASIGGEVTLQISLHSTARTAQTLVVDYAVQHAGARGERSPKVFKGWNLALAPGEARALVKRHSLRPITTRRYHPGWHAVSVQVNGAVVAEGGFELGGELERG